MNWKAQIELLMASGLTLESIAAEMGVTPNAVREIIAGRTKAPRASAAMALLEFIKRRNPEAA